MFRPQYGPSSGCGKAVEHLGAIQKVTSGEMLTNNEKKKFDYKQKILKLLLNMLTSRIEALVSRNKFLYACATCELSHNLMTSIYSSLLLNLCDPIHFFR
jgi:hypothetical protein